MPTALSFAVVGALAVARPLAIAGKPAAAGRLTIVQTQNVAELGELTPETIVTPGIYVDRIIHIPTGDPPVVIS